MNLKRLGLVLSASAGFALLYAACGDGGPSGDGSCTSNANCKTNEICHPVEKVCVQTCNSASDCPDTAKDCRALGTGPGGDAGTADGGTTGQKICHCSTTPLCQGGNAGSSLVCNEETRICVVKCSSDAACGAGRKCDTATGQCKKDTQQAQCSNTSTSIGANGGHDTCQYGQYCDAANTCQAAPEGTCGQATGAGAPTWNKTAKQAPVIVSATAEYLQTTNSMNECAGGTNAALVTIKWYAPNNLTADTTFADLQNHVKFRVQNTGQFFPAHFARQEPPANAKFGEMKIGIACGSNQRSAAVYIADEQGNTSNVVCVSW